jgi:hypothetical protein
MKIFHLVESGAIRFLVSEVHKIRRMLSGPTPS